MDVAGMDMSEGLAEPIAHNAAFERSLDMSEAFLRDRATQLLIGLRLERDSLIQGALEDEEGEDAYLSCVSQISALERMVSQVASQAA